MKKFSKILALLMTAIMLFGIISTFVAQAAEPTPTLAMTASSKGIKYLATSAGIGVTTSSGNNAAGKLFIEKSGTNSNSSIVKNKGVQEVTIDGNKVLKVSDFSDFIAASMQWVWNGDYISTTYANKDNSKAYNLSTSDMFIDFSIASDVVLDAGTDNERLSYPDAVYKDDSTLPITGNNAGNTYSFQIQFYTYDGSAVTAHTVLQGYTKWYDGNTATRGDSGFKPSKGWYFELGLRSSTGTDAPVGRVIGRVKLSEVAKEMNHMTIAVDMDAANIANSKVVLYGNGEYAGHIASPFGTANLPSGTTMGLGRFLHNAHPTTGPWNNTTPNEFSFIWDNIAINYYKHGTYEANTLVDEILTSVGKTNLPLYSLDGDVVYNSNFNASNTNKTTFYQDNSLTNGTSYEVAAAAFKQITNACYIETDKSIADWTWLVAPALEEFYVKYTGTGTFDIPQTWKDEDWSVAETPDANGYVKVSTAAEVEYYKYKFWNGTDFVSYPTQEDASVVAGDVINAALFEIDTNVLPTNEATEFADMTFKRFVGFAKVESQNYNEADLVNLGKEYTFTEEDIELAKAETLYIVPVYEYYTYEDRLFEVYMEVTEETGETDEEGNPIKTTAFRLQQPSDSVGGFAAYFDARKFRTVLSTTNDGFMAASRKLKVILINDVDLDERAAPTGNNPSEITISNAAHLIIDLNGKTLSRTSGITK